jgi:mannose-1-phosphate guanylyltransferase
MIGRRAEWPALVLAAGLGTRLGPLSALRAKAALPVAGQPLIVRILRRLRASGVTRVVINLHHRAETITGIVGDGSHLGLAVRYSWEPKVLGSGGGPARAVPLLASDRFFIVNGDTLSDVPLERLAEAHDRSGADVTLAVAPADLSKYNALLADADGAFVGIAPRGTVLPESGADQAWHFLGVQAVNTAAFAGIDPNRPSDSLRGIYPALTARRSGAVRLLAIGGAFHDIGTPADYLRTAMTLARAEGVALDRGAATRLAPTARVTDCVLWDGVTIGDGAVLSHCIVADGATIPPGARYDRAVITRDGVVPFTV